MVKNPPDNARDWGSIPWRRKWQPTPRFMPGEFHGQRDWGGFLPMGSQRVGHELVTKEQQRACSVHVFLMTYHVEHMQISFSVICGPSLVRCLLRSVAHFPAQQVPPLEVCKPATFRTFMVPPDHGFKLGVRFCSWACPSGLLAGLFCTHTVRVLQHTPISKEGPGLRCPTPALRLTRDYKCDKAESLRLCDERFLLVRFPFH